MIKKILLGAGGVLLLLGLDILLLHYNRTVALSYFFLGGGLLVLGIFFNKFGKVLRWLAGLIYAVPLLMISFLAIYGNIPTTDFSEDVVFVLGAGLSNDQILPTLEARLDQALVYFEKNPAAIFIVCGGYGENQTISEAQAMAGYLMAGGIPQDQILLEDKSTNTYENFAFALEILEREFPEGFTSVIITSNFHIYRSGYLASHFGIQPQRFGAPTPFQMWHSNYMREFLAVFNTWLVQT